MAQLSTRLLYFTSIASAGAIIAAAMLFPPADAQSLRQEAAPATSSAIDYDGFSALTDDVAAYRAERLVDLDTFQKMASEPRTIILDTRSKAAFEAGHFKNAVHLNFSDFTADKLAETIGDPQTRILIYCNNNFVDDAAPVVRKAPPLALNIPTFINLFGYGYENVYELADLIAMDDPSGLWVSGAQS